MDEPFATINAWHCSPGGVTINVQLYNRDVSHPRAAGMIAAGFFALGAHYVEVMINNRREFASDREAWMGSREAARDV
jgi:hypothetical protein